MNISNQLFHIEHKTSSTFCTNVPYYFHKFSYLDLSIKYETTVDDVRKRYSYAIGRIVEALEALDKKVDVAKKDQYLKRVAERSGHIPKGQRWFLLNKVFGLRPSEICEMEGMDKRNSSVRQLIIRVSDQLKAGEISLIEVTPEEAQAAKTRLDAHNAKRRERHDRKKKRSKFTL